MKNIVQKLSKSSPYAVATSESQKDIFDYLHIQTDIEKEYVDTLRKLTEKRIIFLCGSSGDGKSAIMTRYEKEFDDRYEFHLDATHSFSPTESAFERLDKVFDNYKIGNKSLVVGVNIGILINYSKYRKENHGDIKSIIQEYLNESPKVIGEIVFINFEEYPKFESSKDIITSKFLKEIFQKITMISHKNPFYLIYQKGKEKKTILCKNYELLSMESIQDRIIELIVLTHLKYNQFLTARAILDFIYTLLSEEKLLINILFEDSNHEIIKNIRKEDPCLKRDEAIDRFIIKQTNREKNKELNLFLQEIELQDLTPCSILRLFYLLINQEYSNNYHKKFFKNKILIDKYIKILLSHNRFDDSQEVQNFYKDLRKAMFLYINRHKPELTNTLIILESKDFYITVDAKIVRDKRKIQEEKSIKLKSFNCYLLVNEKSIEPIEITFNIYKMIQDINRGYVPNKYDRNNLIIFKEFIDRIIEEIKISNRLIVIDKNNKRYIFNEIDDREIEVEEI